MEGRNKNNFEPWHKIFWGFWSSEISCCVIDCVVSSVSKDHGAFVLRIKQSRLLWLHDHCRWGSVIFETQKPLKQQHNVTYQKTWRSAVLLWEPQILWQLLGDILSFQFKHWWHTVPPAQGSAVMHSASKILHWLHLCLVVMGTDALSPSC